MTYKKIFFLLIFFVSIFVYYQSNHPTKHPDVKSLLKVEVTGFITNKALSLTYEVPKIKHSLLFVGEITTDFSSLGLGLGYNYYLLNKAPYELYLSALAEHIIIFE